MLAGLYLCLAASLYYFRLESSRLHLKLKPDAVMMTLIKPLRGLDDGLRENFEAIAASDPRKRLQVIIAMESEQDPAYAVARDFVSAHADRDIEVFITGPNRGRMGKIHNMIEALPRAKHPYVIFSDADIATTPGLVRETGLAFAQGYDAVFGLPYHLPTPGIGGLFLQIALNHSVSISAALSQYLGGLKFCAGAWMAYTQEILKRVGGLEPFAHAIADDLAISSEVARAGARKYLLREIVPVRETGRGIPEVLEHLAKWAAIIRWSLPPLYFALPLLNLGLMSALLWWLCERSGERLWLGRGGLAAALVSRPLVGAVQDIFVGRRRMPWLHYTVMAFVDLGSFVFWLSGFRARISWRGIRYRLYTGGRAEVI